MKFVDRILNHMRQQAQRATAILTLPRAGIVRNYDPARYAARVELQPEGILTGYLPIKSPFVGNGWGMYCPPELGQVVDVHFQQGGKGAGYIDGAFYSSKTVPISVESGEFLIQHKTGSFIRFTNDGDILISANRDQINHGGRHYAFDANGQGQLWNGSNVETWQDNDAPGAPHHNHAPPKIPT